MPTRSAPPEALLDRFLTDCRALADIGRGDRIGLAVSGGPDSLALLLLADAVFRGQIMVATVDHHLRAESTAEAQFVAALCGELGVAHTILRLPVRPRGNISARARELRYAQLSEWGTGLGLDWLMTGHHADDQLETMIMRLNRGSGVGGLASIRAVNSRAIRPLLGWRRAELAALVAAAGLTPVDDPSNVDDRYDRARLRKALATADWLDPLAFVRSAAALSEANGALAWASIQFANQRVKVDGERLVFDAAGLPAELVRRIVERCLRKLNPRAQCDGAKLTRLLALLHSGRKATLDGVACDARGADWVFTLAPARRPTNG